MKVNLMAGIATLADVEAMEASGSDAGLPASTYALIRRSAQAHPYAPALSYIADATRPDQVRTWSYRALLAEVTRAANAFQALGAGRDTVIAVLLPNLPEAHFAIWGAQAAGVAMPLNTFLAPSAIAALMKEAGASLLVTLAPSPGMDLWTGLRPALAEVPTLRHVLLVETQSPQAGGDGFRAQAGPLAGQDYVVHGFSEALRREEGEALTGIREIDADDYSSFLGTGGTTGQPKIAMRRHRNEVANAWSAAMCLGDAMQPGKNVFCGLPLFHANGLLVTGLLPFLRGAHVVIGTALGYRGHGVIERFWSIIERQRIHFFSAVPTIFAALLQVPRDGHRIDSLEFGLCGAAPMPRELIERFQQETGLQVLEGYGLTEGTCVSSLNPPFGERRAGSVGLRVPGQAMKSVLVDPAGRYLRDAKDGETGTIVISGPNVFAGYLSRSAERAPWLDLGDGRRWLDTGDLGHRDAQGYFWLTGRSKDLIIRGGHNIDPAMIEEALYAHPGVHLAAAIGRPDPRVGELPVAYVQAKPGFPLTEPELLAHLERHVAERAAVPKAVVLVDTMPLTPIGKIHKPELRRREAERARNQDRGPAHA